MTLYTDYTPVTTVLQDLQRDDEPVRPFRTTSTHYNKAQKPIPLEEITCRPRTSKLESNDALLRDDNARNCVSLPPVTARKPFFLHPSMWMWEILSLALAILILVAIIIVLAIYDGKPSPVFGGITLNTVVAFAATLFRICLMVPVTDCICQLTWVWLQKGYKPLHDIVKFDMASRGPLGSLRLLREFKYSPVISIAGSIVVIGIAIGPFLQQSVVFYSASVPGIGVDGEPLRGFASAAFTYTGSVGNVGSNWASFGEDVPFNLKSAMYSGLYASGMISLPYPPYSCHTGNCTWDPFPTLGVSAQCFDDTANYFLNCSETNSKVWPEHPFRPCVMVARNLQALNLAWAIEVYNSQGTFNAMPPKDSIAPYNSSSFDYGFPGDPRNTSTSMNAGFAAFRWNLARNLLIFPAKQERASVITSESIIEAGYCIFYVGVQIISARVQNGVYEEAVVNSTTRIQPYQNMNTTSFPGMPEHYIGVDEKGNLTYTYEPTCQTLAPPTKCNPVNITIPHERYRNIVAALAKVLPWANLTTNRQAGLVGTGSMNPDAAEALYRSPNITKTMHTVAHYISVALRANDTILAQQTDPNNDTRLPADYVAPSHRVTGMVYIQTVLLRVRWGWLVFPAALVLIVAGLLFETIRTSRPEAVGVWKNNALAVLLNTQWRLDNSIMGAATSEDMEKIAKRLEARVVEGECPEGARRAVIIRNRHVS